MSALTPPDVRRSTWPPPTQAGARERGDQGGGSWELRPLLVALPLAMALIGSVAIGSTALATLAAGAAILVSLVSPASGIVILALVSPLIGRPLLPTPGVVAFLIGAILFGSLIRLSVERSRIFIQPALLVGSAFMLFVFVHQLPEMLGGYSGESEHVGSVFLRLVTGFGAVLASALALRGRSPFATLTAISLAAAVAAVIAILMFDNPDVGGPLANLTAAPEADVRPSGVFANPNYYGWFTATSLVLTVGLLAASRSLRGRVGLLAIAVVLAVGLAVSQSRGGFLSALVGIVLLVLIRNRRVGVLVAVVGALLAVVLIPLLVEWRLTNSIGTSSGYAQEVLANSDAGRLDAVLVGPRLFLTSPLFGLGPGHYVIEAGTYSHNWYMSVLAELGTVGVVLWALLLVSVAGALWHRPMSARAIGLGVLTVWTISSLFLEPPLETQGSVPTAIIITAAVVGDWSRRGRPTPSPPSLPWSRTWPAPRPARPPAMPAPVGHR